MGGGVYIHPKNVRVVLLIEMAPVITVLNTFADALLEITIRRRSRALPVAGRNTGGMGMLALYNWEFGHRFGGGFVLSIDSSGDGRPIHRWTNNMQRCGLLDIYPHAKYTGGISTARPAREGKKHAHQLCS